MCSLSPGGRGKGRGGRLKMIRFSILTVSDKGYRGEREDISANVIKTKIEKLGYELIDYKIVPDDKGMIKDTLTDFCDKKKVDLIFTTGGTGFSPRDLTPEATKEIVEKEVPGVSEIIRLEGYKITPHSMLSRGYSGIRGGTLIINLPGSPKAVEESLEVIIPILDHGIEVLRGEAYECATKQKNAP